MSANSIQEDIDKEPAGLHRVKVYRLNEHGNWDDRGTGLITVQNLEKSAAMGLVVMDEEEPSKALLIHRMSKDLVYKLQDATLILWQDADAASDLAISFEEAAGCQLIWKEIQQEQRRHGINPYANNKHHMIDEIDGNQPHSAGDHPNGFVDLPLDLPMPELGNLPAINDALRSIRPSQWDDSSGKWLKNPGAFVQKLLECFRTAEDLEDLSSLRECFHIVKLLLILIDGDLLDILFADQNVMDMIGALEYDPNLPEKGNYRSFLRDVVIFKEPVPLRNPEIRSKIHQTYRIGYVRDVILPRTLDESAFSTLSSTISFNNVDILNAIIEEKEVFQDLIVKFRNSQPGSETWVDIISFLTEMASLSKHLPLQNQCYLFELLASLGIFEILTSAIQHGDERVRSKATDVLLVSLQNKPSLLRDFLIGPISKQEPRGVLRNPTAPKYHSPLFDLLIGFLTSDTSSGLQEQVVEILRNLLSAADSDTNDFLTAFYDVYMPRILKVLERGCDKSLSPEEGPSPQVLSMVLDILCYCVFHHQYRIQFFVLNNKVFEKVLKILQRKERWLVCAAIRFIRACLSTKDIFYNRYMIRENLFEPIITVFVENGERYNLLNSVVLELFNFIYINGMRDLINHFMESQYYRVEDVDYDQTFAQLKNKWEQMREVQNRANEGGPHPEDLSRNRLQKDPRALDREEESYFDEADDDEPGPSGAVKPSDDVASGFPLVDYDDEDLQSPKGGQHGLPTEGLGPEPPEKRMRFMDQRAAPNFQAPADYPPSPPPHRPMRNWPV